MTPSMALVPERTIEVDSDLYVAVFTTHGARLKSFKLNKYRQSADKNSPPYEMVQVAPGGRLPLGAVMTRGGNVVDDSDFNYDTNAPAENIRGGGGCDGGVRRQRGGRHYYHQDFHLQAVGLRLYDGRCGLGRAAAESAWGVDEPAADGASGVLRYPRAGG